MKSAKNKKDRRFFALFSLLLSAIVLVGCEWSSFISNFHEEPLPPDTSEGNGIINTNTSTEPPKPLFYNRYTGLACDEAISSCRPISVSIGNFDQKQQEGLSFADILIEAPLDGDVTRFWAITTNWSAITNLQSIASAKSYMMPMVNAFGAIAVYNGMEGTPNTANADTIDYASGRFDSNFTAQENGILSSDGEKLLNAAVKENFNMKDTDIVLPYQIAPLGTPYIPSGNKISSIHYTYSEKNTVNFSYDATSNVYLRASSGQAHTDPISGKPLSFSNVILLFYNVSYYHTANGTSYLLDTSAGGNGFCYTNGGVVPIKWSYDSTGNLVFLDQDGKALTVNRGKTFIGMLKITDSTKLVAS